MTARHVRITGVDLSLTSTGIARITVDPDGTPSTYTTTVGRTGEANETLLQRWMRIDDLACAVNCEVTTPDLVLIEAPSYAAKFGHPHDRSGAWWLLVDALHTAGIPVAEVPPPVLKTWVTGRGNAAKPVVTQRVVEHYGDAFTLPLGAGRADVADAIGLATLGAAYLGAPLVALPETHTRALASVRWPANLTPGVLL